MFKNDSSGDGVLGPVTVDADAVPIEDTGLGVPVLDKIDDGVVGENSFVSREIDST